MKYLPFFLFLFISNCYSQKCGIDFDKSTGIYFVFKDKELKAGLSNKNKEELKSYKRCLGNEYLSNEQKAMLANGIASIYSYHTNEKDSVISYVNLALSLDKEWYLYHLVLMEFIVAGDDDFYKNKLHPYYLFSDSYIFDEIQLLDEFDKTKYYLKVKEQNASKQKKVEPNNQVYASTLSGMKQNDQKFRQEENMVAQKELDATNRVVLDSLFSKYGFPSLDKVGSDQVLTPWLVLQHSTDCEWNKKWIKRFLDAYQSGEIKKGLLLYTFDRFYNLEDGYCRKENEQDVVKFMEELKQAYPPEFAKTFGYKNY